MCTQIREGFIVDEDEDEEEGEGEENRERRKKKKRRRAERDDEEKLDEEDLDLIGEAIPSWERNKESAQVCYCTAGTREVTANTPLVKIQAPEARPSR